LTPSGTIAVNEYVRQVVEQETSISCPQTYRDRYVRGRSSVS